MEAGGAEGGLGFGLAAVGRVEAEGGPDFVLAALKAFLFCMSKKSSFAACCASAVASALACWLAECPFVLPAACWLSAAPSSSTSMRCWSHERGGGIMAGIPGGRIQSGPRVQRHDSYPGCSLEGG